MPVTPIYALPYPALSDPPNGPSQFQALAEEVETELSRIDSSITTINATLAGIAPNPIIARKTVDESVTSSTALQNDDHISFSVTTSAVYFMDGYIAYSGAADPAGGLKIDWTLPAGASLRWTSFASNYSGGLTQYDVVGQVNTTVRNYPTNAGVVMSMQPRGFLVTGGTSGTLQMRWAQVASNATPTTLLTNSMIRLIKVV